MQVLALCSQTGILMLNLGQLHLKFLFFFFNAVSLVSLLSSALRWFHSDVQQLVVVSASRTVFENQAEENAAGKWIKHPQFPTGNTRAAACAASPVMERAAAWRHAWVCAAQPAEWLGRAERLRGEGSTVHPFGSARCGAAVWELQYLSSRACATAVPTARCKLARAAGEAVNWEPAQETEAGVSLC